MCPTSCLDTHHDIKSFKVNGKVNYLFRVNNEYTGKESMTLNV